MHYPAPLVSGSTIAITAFSSGIEPEHKDRFDAIIAGLENKGFKVVIGNCLYGECKGASAPAKERAEELQRFLMDDTIDAIAPPWGGELAMELLPLLDFNAIAQAKPKWVFGFSDVSTITSVLTCKLNWATVHGPNLIDLIYTEQTPMVRNFFANLETKAGETFKQEASQRYATTWTDFAIEPLSTLNCEHDTQWKWLVKPEKGDEISGRLIGGCWDTLQYLFGTSYLDIASLKGKNTTRILLYLENVELSPCDLTRSILNMEFNGVFDVIDGLLLGRNMRTDSKESEDLHYLDVLKNHLANKNIPVMYDMDIGHFPPNLTLINGATAEISLVEGKGVITQTLKSNL
jgi:muramoyltetrapeptide carboxypeptidase LdcA involved in peptidoglycan recycling